MDKQQNTNLSALLRKLSERGCPVDLSVADEEVELPKVEIAQTGPVYGSTVFDLEDGRAGYIFGVDLINHSSTPIYSPEFELRRAWQDPAFEWLPDPWAPYRHGHHCYYSFPGKGAPEFPRDQVLNHLLLSENGVLQPRTPYKGYLLAIGGPMPKQLRHGDDVEATLLVTIPDHSEFVEPILLFADRCAVKPKVREREGSLYEGPDGSKIVPVVGESQRSDPGGTASVRRPGSLHW